MKQLAPGVWQLRGLPPNAVNVYLVEDVLIDAATRRAPNRILKQIAGRKVNTHALTHAHPDHQGASAAICDRLGIPYWVGAVDVPLAEDLDEMRKSQAPHPLNRLIMKYWAGPARVGQASRWRLTAGRLGGRCLPTATRCSPRARATTPARWSRACSSA